MDSQLLVLIAVWLLVLEVVQHVRVWYERCVFVCPWQPLGQDVQSRLDAVWGLLASTQEVLRDPTAGSNPPTETSTSIAVAVDVCVGHALTSLHLRLARAWFLQGATSTRVTRRTFRDPRLPTPVASSPLWTPHRPGHPCRRCHTRPTSGP